MTPTQYEAYEAKYGPSSPAFARHATLQAAGMARQCAAAPSRDAARPMAIWTQRWADSIEDGPAS